jgi:hypothetical protein
MTTATMHALLLGIDEQDIVDCVLALTPDDFYKTMPSEKRQDLFQDVYKPKYGGERLYVKLQGSTDGNTVIISFKRDNA